MNHTQNTSLTDLHGKICENGAISIVRNNEFTTTVDSLDYFNVSLLKGSLSNCTTLKKQPSVSNNTIIS